MDSGPRHLALRPASPSAARQSAKNGSGPRLCARTTVEAVHASILIFDDTEVTATPDPTLRPLERRVLRLAAEGLDDAEIGRRFRRSPEWVGRVRVLAQTPRSGAHMAGDVLRPLERRILRWRAAGLDHEALSSRFRRTPRFLRQVESLAHYKLRLPDDGSP
jgi:DNA-binding CsgD family transcriptional regulator